jgi:hypothetical protein
VARRLDTPGHDAARLDRNEAGWRLQGTAVFLLEVATTGFVLKYPGLWEAVAGSRDP